MICISENYQLSVFSIPGSGLVFIHSSWAGSGARAWRRYFTKTQARVATGAWTGAGLVLYFFRVTGDRARVHRNKGVPQGLRPRRGPSRVLGTSFRPSAPVMRSCIRGLPSTWTVFFDRNALTLTDYDSLWDNPYYSFNLNHVGHKLFRA